MLYASKRSEGRIVHRDCCRYIKMIPEKNRVQFWKMKKAMEMGYCLCRYCAPIWQYLKREGRELDSFCKKNGLFYSFNRGDGSLDVISRTGKWKVIVCGRENFIWLYHKNLYEKKGRESIVPGYHSQSVRRSTLMGYLKYVAEHDAYRKAEPLYECQKKGKGWQFRHDQKQLEKKVRRKQSISYVLELLNGMSEGRIAY